MRVVSCSASSNATSRSARGALSVIARSTSARSTVSGVLSSWLASAVNRRSAAKELSRRSSMAFIVSTRRWISSPSAAGSRRCSDRPSVIACSSLMIRSTGCSARPAIA